MSVVDLLRMLVRIPSVSGEEEACRDALARWLEGRGLPVTVVGRNVLAVLEGREADAGGLLLCSHIDVVPVGPGWTRDPFDAALEDERVFGRGSNDAKASVAAMAWAAARVDPAELRGRLVLAFVCDEETGGEGLEVLAPDLPPITAAVIGEPTELDVCPGQRGLLRLTLVAKGRSAHASRPWEGQNAIQLAARDVLAVHGLGLGSDDALLGPATLQATVIQGGTRPNVLPARCTIELDGRTTPAFDNDRMIDAVRSAVLSEVVVRSRRFEPVSTPLDARIVEHARRASPGRRVRPFGGVSDLFHVRRVPGVVLGPGTSAASHSADEWVAVDQVERATAVYERIIRSWLCSKV